MQGSPATKTPIWLVDTTLQLDECYPGSTFSSEDRFTIASALSAAGIDELRLGEAARPGVTWTEPLQLRERGVGARLTGWCHLREEDVAAALKAAVTCVHIAVPASDLHLQLADLKKSTMLDRLERCLDMIVGRGRIASVAAIDASRCDADWLARLAAFADDHGAERFCVTDTVGIWEPFVVSGTIARLRRSAPQLKLGIQAQNDLGLAAANCLAAARAGAADLDVAVGGLGERAGSAPLEQVAVALEVTGLKQTSLDLSKLPYLCSLVAQAGGQAIPPNAPVVGQRAFFHSSRDHVNGILKDPRAFEGFAPSLCGRERELAPDPHSGATALHATLASLKLTPHAPSILRRLATVLRERGVSEAPLDALALVEMLTRAASIC